MTHPPASLGIVVSAALEVSSLPESESELQADRPSVATAMKPNAAIRTRVVLLVMVLSLVRSGR